MASTITCVSAAGARDTTALSSWLAGATRDAAREETVRWIKRLRLVRYGTRSMRERFLYRDESLWWFTEIYLHKMRRLDAAVATVVALDAAKDVANPARIVIETSDHAVREAALAFGAARGVPVEVSPAHARDTATSLSSYLVGITAALSRMRPVARVRPRKSAVAAFVHTAFWKHAATSDGPGQEGYIGRVLDAVAARVAASDLTCVGVGPSRNFRSRRWWDPLVKTGSTGAITPIERLAPQSALRESMTFWRHRTQLADTIVEGSSVREAAVVLGCDLWNVLRQELRAAALVQWPWSARAMDEAASAIDSLQPGVVVTYAEAGGWGRALMIEARRRGVPSIALQHGLIYRHWLNYLHDPDEMTPLGGDRGFPLPDQTLVFDRYAADHLRSAGNFPATAITLTGSPSRDDLAARIDAQRARGAATMRHDVGAPADRPLLVLVAKFSEIRADLPELFAAIEARPVHLIVKPHPADAADAYGGPAKDLAHVSIASADADLACLLASADGLVTMNSTVAVDGLAFGLPSFVVGLPNNLSPFVDAGVMIGSSAGGIGAGLDTLLYDRAARQTLAARAAAFVDTYAMRPDGRAADRAADRIVAAIG